MYLFMKKTMGSTTSGQAELRKTTYITPTIFSEEYYERHRSAQNEQFSI